MKEKKEKKDKSTFTPPRMASIVFGVIFLIIPFAYNRLIVSDSFSPAINTRPVSLACSFQSLEFSKWITTSNITHEEMALLNIASYGEYVIPNSELEFQGIKHVGLLS